MRLDMSSFGKQKKRKPQRTRKKVLFNYKVIYKYIAKGIEKGK